MEKAKRKIKIDVLQCNKNNRKEVKENRVNL